MHEFAVWGPKGEKGLLNRRNQTLPMTNPNKRGWWTLEVGYGMDFQWSDDFHHALFALLYSPKEGETEYYADFGDLDDLRQATADVDTGGL